jgi:rSAM/selenodomain-associated transferase 2/rSAM/selenodomain-associated transferase 1
MIHIISKHPSKLTDKLIIFTRYPEAGKTKTRLIPALGSEGAADLQRLMTEYTLKQAKALLDFFSENLDIEIRFAGGDEAKMQAWLGEGDKITYHPQSEGDLGARMLAAFTDAFNIGMTRVIIIGIDCPDLDAAILKQAFDQLKSHDLILGQAADGGYYLIGLRRLIPELFTGIDWGSDRVLSQTLTIAKKLGSPWQLLPELADIDRPEDLHILINHPQLVYSPPKIRPKISIIVPVLNEAAMIETTLQQIRANISPENQDRNSLEIIVVDGGSQDKTGEIAQSLGVQVISTAPGRANQMNAGAKRAIGEILLFLHADTQLPQRFDRIVLEQLEDPEVIAGAFELCIDSQGWGLRAIETGVKWRSRWLSLPYGDQGIFLRSEVFRQLGGFAQLPIMEDFELISRLKKLGKIAIAPVAVRTSARRWQKLGLLKTTVINQLMIIGYYLGVSPDRLASWYRGNQEFRGK